MTRGTVRGGGMTGSSVRLFVGGGRQAYTGRSTCRSLAVLTPPLAWVPSGAELLVILAVLLIFFGNRVPGVARSLGKGVTEFKAGLKEGGSSPEDSRKDDEPKTRGDA